MFHGFSIKGDCEAIDYPMQKMINAVQRDMSSLQDSKDKPLILFPSNRATI